MQESLKKDAASEGAEIPDRSPNGLLARLRSWLAQAQAGEGHDKLEGMIEAEPGVSGATRHQARQMMGKLIAFSHLRVDDVVVPRADIIAIEASAPLRDLLHMFTTAQHSRLPVYRETLDDPVGMIHIKDLLGLLEAKARSVPEKNGDNGDHDLVLPGELLSMPVEASGLLRPLLFAPPSMPAGDLLVKMQTTRLHMAIVVDEYGGTEGLATIEDLVEEIVGEIADEHDVEEKTLIIPAADGSLIANARADIEELERLLGVDLLPPEQDEETDTLGGLVFTMLGRVPVRGEIIRHDSGIEFEVLEADPRRVKKLRIVTPREEPEAGA